MYPSCSDTAPKLDLLSCLQDQESTHLTTGTLRQTLSHPYHLLPIIRLQFSLIFQEKHIHSSTRWQKSDVSSMHNFVEVQSPPDDNTQPALCRLMVTEVDRRGNRHNRQPEYFSMASSAIFVPARMAGLTHGINPRRQPGVAIFRFRRSLRVEIG